MTLILNYCKGKKYVLVTSDTLIRGTKIPENGIMEVEEAELTSTRHARKVHKVSKYVFAGLSGSYGYIEPVYEEIMSIVQNNEKELYLEDFIPILEKSISKVNEDYKDNEIYQLNKDRDLYILCLTGFYKDKSTGMLIYRQNEIKQMKAQDKQNAYFLMSPSEDLAERKNEIFIQDSQLNPGDIIKERIMHFLGVHAAASLAQPELISPTVNVVLLVNQGDEGIQLFETQHDMSEIVDKLDLQAKKAEKEALMKRVAKKKRNKKRK